MTDTVNIPASVPAESPEHVAKMVARADQATQSGNTPADAPPPAGDQPPPQQQDKLLAGKYKSVEDLEKAYSELQKKLGAPKDEPSGETPTPPNSITIAPDATDADVATQLQERGLDFNEFAAEFNSSGTLSDGSYEKLAKAGIPKEVVDQFIEGRSAMAAAIRSDVIADVGGEEGFKQMAAWAAKNLTPEQIEAFNAQVGPGATKAGMKLAVNGLYALYTASNGREPKLVHGEAAGAVGGYQSVEEMKTDMRDPRYRSDPSFRAQVEAKVARTTAF